MGETVEGVLKNIFFSMELDLELVGSSLEKVGDPLERERETRSKNAFAEMNIYR